MTKVEKFKRNDNGSPSGSSSDNGSISSNDYNIKKQLEAVL